MKATFKTSLIIIAGLYLLSSLLSLFVQVSYSDIAISQVGNVALISVEGIISSQPSQGIFTSSESMADTLINRIEKADENTGIKAIVLEINSPGGYPVATDEIAQAVKKAKKPTVAVIREVAASGGYWIASSADHVIANRMSITGSIGVIGSYLEFPGLMERYNVTYRRLVAGENKDIGTPFKEMTNEEERLYQAILDKMHGFFIEEVQMNRGLSDEQAEEVSTGMIFLGSEALELGLVDELGGFDEAESYLNMTHNITVSMVEYKKERSFFDTFAGLTGSLAPYLARFKYSGTSIPSITFT